MSSKALLITLSYLCVALVAASPAVANPPVLSWQRGSEGTTYQEWYFGTNDDTPAPDDSYNPYATQNDPVLLHVDTQHGWYDSIDLGQGVWALSGEMDLVIPNSSEPNPYKQILLELVWKLEENDPTGAPFAKDPFLPDTPLVAVTPFSSMEMTLDDAVDLNGWHHSAYEITISPNPSKEWLTVKGNILVDSLSVDTICVPEPATIVLFAAGAVVAARKRKRKK
jgi:hypothetical protein